MLNDMLGGFLNRPTLTKILVPCLIVGSIFASVKAYTYYKDRAISKKVKNFLADDEDEEVEVDNEDFSEDEKVEDVVVSPEGLNGGPEEPATVEPKRVRRTRDNYVKELVMRLRATYGTSSGTPAQNRALRDAINVLMDERNVHFHQRNGIIERVLVLLAIPGDAEITASKLGSCREARKRKAYKQSC